MRLGKLYESYTTPDIDFLRLYQQTDLKECKTLKETLETINNIFLEADKFARNNKLAYTYFQLAKKPLWEELEIEKQHFIYKGFDAWVEIDLINKNFNNIEPFITIKNNNIESLQEGQRINIDYDFINSLNTLQKNIFTESLNKLEIEAMDKIKKVWVLEQQRLDKWVKTTKINLKGDE